MRMRRACVCVCVCGGGGIARTSASDSLVILLQLSAYFAVIHQRGTLDAMTELRVRAAETVQV